MEHKRLRYFISVMETGQFNLAAVACGVSTQAVSQAIGKLEQELRVKLFDRTAFGASPTVMAVALERRARAILAESRLAAAELDALSGAKYGVLNVGFGYSFATRIMPKALRKFLAKRPGIAVNALIDVTEVLHSRLLAGELDIVLSAPPLDFELHPDIQTEKVYLETEAPMVRKGHPLTRVRRVSVKDLAGYPWIADRNSAARWRAICRAFGNAGVAPPTEVTRTNSTLLTRGMMIEWDCICVSGTELFAREIEGGEIHVLNVPELKQTRPAYLALRRTGSQIPAVRAFLPVLREICDKTAHMIKPENVSLPRVKKRLIKL